MKIYAHTLLVLTLICLKAQDASSFLSSWAVKSASSSNSHSIESSATGSTVISTSGRARKNFQLFEAKRDNSVTAAPTGTTPITPDQEDFAKGYINKHHNDVILSFAEAFTPLGVIQAQKNAFSGGSYVIKEAKLVGIHYDEDHPYITLDVTVQIRGEKQPQLNPAVKVYLDAQPNEKVMTYSKNQKPVIRPFDQSNNTNQLDDFIRRMNRLCCIVNAPAMTGKLIQLGFQLGGSTLGLLEENMYLNQVPHNRFVRQYFYDLAANATLEAVQACSDGKISNLMKVVSLFPEMNPSMDSYRIGTLLELTRDVALTLAEQNLRVRVCVQQSMGVGIFTGTPKQLSGAAILLQKMDWKSGEGEINEGILGDYINFGQIGSEHVINAQTDRRGNQIEQDDIFILLCPQSMVGVETSIIGALEDMVKAAGDRPVILINPDLTDKVSSQGQQNIRGRQERIDFANSFKTVYHFQCTYVTGTSYFPILGALNKPGYDETWISYQRRDRANNDGEIYVPMLSTEGPPDGQMMLDTFDN